MAGQGDLVGAFAERLIARACRRLPDGPREELVAEWSGELPAILSDPSRRFYVRRAWIALRFAQGHFGTVRRMASAVSLEQGARWAAFRRAQALAASITESREFAIAVTFLAALSGLIGVVTAVAFMNGVPRIALVALFCIGGLLPRCRVMWIRLRLRFHRRKPVAE